jgi:hypothetical protein
MLITVLYQESAVSLQKNRGGYQGYPVGRSDYWGDHEAIVDGRCAHNPSHLSADCEIRCTLTVEASFIPAVRGGRGMQAKPMYSIALAHPR